MFFYKLFFCFLCFFSFSGFSQDVKRVEIEIKTDEMNRRLIIEKALNEVSRSFVKDFLGEKKFNMEIDKIENVVIKNQNKYVLFTKMGKSEEQEDGTYLTKVSLGLSKDNLQSLLVEHNLFYSSEGSSCVLPIVSFETQLKNKKKYAWWKDSFQREQNIYRGLAEIKQNTPRSLAQAFYSSLNQEMIKNGFYSVDPVFARIYDATPRSFLPRGNQSQDFISLSKFLSCDIVLSGTVDILKNNKSSSYVGQWSFNIFNIKTKQKLFEFNKEMKLVDFGNEVDLEKEFKNKLSYIFNSVGFQLSSYKDRGSLDLNRMIVSVQGPLDYHQKEKLKKYLVKEIPSLKRLQERLLASNKIVYEAEISKDASRFNSDLNKILNNPSFSIIVNGYNNQQVDLYAKEK
ncbi:MAG: hypothetical protein ACR2M7_03035 [Bdellovibrionales bacterium]